MKVDFKTGFFFLLIIVLGVYIGNMWTQKMIEQAQKQKEYEAYLAQLAQQGAGTTA